MQRIWVPLGLLWTFSQGEASVREDEEKDASWKPPWMDEPGQLAITPEELAELRKIAAERRLQYITTLEDMPLPDNHVLSMVEAGGATSWTCSSFCTSIEGAHAGAQYTTLEIGIPGGTFQFTDQVHNAARLKVVDNTMTEPQARDGQCQAGQPLVAEASEVENTWGQPFGSSTTVVGADTLRADDALVFRMGGNYRLCYSANGTFGLLQADITRQRLEVNGVFDRSPSCTTTDCLSRRLYQCYMRREEFNTADGKYGLQSSCVVDYSYAGAGFFGPPGRGSWTAEFVTTYDETGTVTNVQEQPCAQSEPAAFICRDGGACEAGDPYITPDTTVSSKRINIPTTRNDLFGMAFGSTTTYNARTVAACYCPDRNGCTNTVDFIQQIGILHFYLSKVCHAGNAACTEDFTGVTGQYRFRIRVECPSDACMLNDQNRVKLVEKTLSNDLPSWDSGNGCRTGLHGIISGLEVLPTTQYVPIDGSPTGVLNELNCDQGSPVGCRLSGGTRQDYKTFGGTYGFRFILGSSDHEARGFHTSKEVDVCYCNGDCNTGSNWFKVGSMRVSPTRLVSAATSRSELPAQWSVEFVNQPGIIGLHRPYADGGVLGLQENSLLKLVPDKEKQIGDDGCALSGYNSQFSQGLSSEVAASTNYLGKLQTQTPPDLQKVVFNTNSFVNTITVTEAGTLAVCYCAVTVDSTCPVPSNWKLVTHLTVKGPQINQRWTFSTNVVFRFSYEGYGLTSGDTIRIISSDGKCTDNNYNPNTAAFAYTALKVKCPVPCSEVTLTGGTEVGDLTTKVLSSDSYNCDVNNENCETNDITSITVVSATETELTFQKDHGLQTGDEITLGANIFCAAGDSVCTAEMLTALKGAFPFADADSNSGTAPEMYLAAHKFTALADPKKGRIQIGWPTPAPQFTIIYAGARPEIGYIGRGGLRTHHSRAQTREEVMATAERANLRVCWRFGGNGAKYVEEIGKMTIRNPATMLGATISMSSAARKTAVPMILTFTTAGGVTGIRYEEAQDSLRLKIVFLRTDLLDILYADLAGSDIPFTVSTEDDFGEASQAICGKLFLELWSADMERGFPMPKGCYYKGYPTGNRREVFVVFEGKNGLRKDTTYQMECNHCVWSPDWPRNFKDDSGIRWSTWAHDARGLEEGPLVKPDLLSDTAMALPMSTMTSGKRKTYPNRSMFQAHVCCVMDPEQVPKIMESLQKSPHLSSVRSWPHACRILSPFDGQVHVCSEDDEDPGAGEKILGLLEKMGLENLLLVVSHWNSGGVNRLGTELFKCVTEQCKELLKELQEALRASFPPEELLLRSDGAEEEPLEDGTLPNGSGIESTSDLPLWDDATSWHVDVGAIGATPPAELMHASRGVGIQSSRRTWPKSSAPSRTGAEPPAVVGRSCFGAGRADAMATEQHGSVGSTSTERTSQFHEAEASKASQTFMTEGNIPEGVDFNDLSNEELEKLCQQLENDRESLEGKLAVHQEVIESFRVPGFSKGPSRKLRDPFRKTRSSESSFLGSRSG